MVKLTFVTAKIACLVCLCILFIGIGQTAVAQTESPPAEEEQNSDSEKTYPEKRKSHETWETIVSFPGKLIFFPIKMLFSGIGTAAALIDEGKIIPKVIDIFTSDDGRRSIQPVYSSRTGGGLKFRQRDLLTKESTLELQGTMGIRRRYKYKAAFQGIQIKSAFYADIIASYQLLSDEKFFGLGNKSDKANESNYAHKQAIAEFALSLKISKKVSAFAQIGYEVSEIQKGRDKNLPSTTDPNLYREDTLPGLGEQVKFSKLKLAFHYNGKNHPGRPTAGGELRASGSIFNELGGSKFGFRKVSVDISHYINLFYNRILVLRLAGEFNRALSGKKIPFYYLSEIGYRETVRGFKRGRFRANDMILGSLEYRYPIWTYVDAVLFVDAGKVSEDIFEDFSTKDFHVGYGGGMRIWGFKGMVAKFELGKSKDGIRFYFVLSKAI